MNVGVESLKWPGEAEAEAIRGCRAVGTATVAFGVGGGSQSVWAGSEVLRGRGVVSGWRGLSLGDELKELPRTVSREAL